MKNYSIILESYSIPALESDIDYSQRPRLFTSKFRSILAIFNILANTILHNDNVIPESEDYRTFINSATSAKGFIDDVLTNNSIEELSANNDFMESIESLDTSRNKQIIENLGKIALISTVALTTAMKARPQSIKNADGALAWFKFGAKQVVSLYNDLFNK